MKIRDRIKELRRVKASELTANTENWREHSKEQRNALQAVLKEVGFAGALLAREVEGKLILIDGHLRADVADDEIIPVLILDVNEQEAKKILATFDPIGALATTDQKALTDLVNSIQATFPEFDSLLKDIDPSVEINPLEGLDPPPGPPAMSWVLIGLPTVRYGEIAEQVTELTKTPGVIVNTSVGEPVKL